MSYNHTFHWPKGASDVVLTGTFDNWSGSLPLVKTSSGDFELTFPLKPENDKEDKFLFKFIVDGEWVTSSEYETFKDSSGHENNVIYVKNLTKENESSSQGTRAKIPEAGGLEVPILGGVAASVGAFLGSGSGNKVDTAVLPSQEGKQVSLTGEPGVLIPQDPYSIGAFSEVRDVDAAALNARLNDENKLGDVDIAAAGITTSGGKSGAISPSTLEPQQQDVKDKPTASSQLPVSNPSTSTAKEPELKATVMPVEELKQPTLAGEPGIAIPANADEIDEFSHITNVDAKALNGKLNGETGDNPKKKKLIKVKKIIKRNKRTGEETVISVEPVEATNDDGSNSILIGNKKGASQVSKDAAIANGGKPETAPIANGTAIKEEASTASKTLDPKKEDSAFVSSVDNLKINGESSTSKLESSIVTEKPSSAKAQTDAKLDAKETEFKSKSEAKQDEDKATIPKKKSMIPDNIDLTPKPVKKKAPKKKEADPEPEPEKKKKKKGGLLKKKEKEPTVLKVIEPKKQEVKKKTSFKLPKKEKVKIVDDHDQIEKFALPPRRKKSFFNKWYNTLVDDDEVYE